MSYRLFGGLAAALALGFAISACGEKAPEVQEPVDVKPRGPDYEVFAPLERATMDVTLPMIVGGDEDTNRGCFLTKEDLAPTEADIVVKELIEQNSAAAADAVVKWLVEDLEPSGLTASLASNWDISFEELVQMELPRDQVRFSEDPQCLTKSGWLSEEQHLATTVFGAKKLVFETTLPVTQDLQEELLRAVGMQNIVMESESLFVYEPAVSEAGEPMLDPEGNQLFNSPSGEYILEKDIPPVEERQMKNWTFTAQNPIYFAFKQFPRSAWRKEGAKDKCNVIIIPDALNPQPPDCAEFKESAFSVTILEDEDKPVSLTIKTGEEIKGVQLAWKEATRIQVNDRIILWIMPEKVEVGVNLWLNSLTINPAPMPEGEGGDGEPGYGYVPVDDAKEAAAEEKKEEDEAKKKKKKKSSDNALDAYLND